MTELKKLQTRAMAALNNQDVSVADELQFFDVKQLLDAVTALLRNEPVALLHADVDALVRRLAATALIREVNRRLEVADLEDEATGA